MRAVHLFLESDMRCGHNGLVSIASKSKVKLGTLGTGEVAVFVNGAKDKMKIYAANGVVAYLRLEGRKLKASDLGAFTDAIVPGSTPTMGATFRSQFFNAMGVKVTEVVMTKKAANA